MSSFKVPLRLRLQVSFRGLLGVLKQPAYATVFYLSFWIVLGVFVWLANRSLLLDYIGADHTAYDKLQFFLTGYTSLVTNFSPGSALIVIVFSFLTGLNISLMSFVISKSYKEALASGTKNIFAIVAATIGVGCAACGTSFLAPLLVGVSGATSITLTLTIGVIANVVGLALLVYSVFRLGTSAATALAKGF